MTTNPARADRLRSVVLLLAVLLVGMAAPSVAGSVVARAKNADEVDGLSAVKSQAGLKKRRGRLVATDRKTGLLPNDLIAEAPDSDRLDGLDSATFARADAVHHDQVSCNAYGMIPLASGQSYDTDNGYRYSSTGTLVGCTLSLPVGATVRSFTADVVDGNGTENISCYLRTASVSGSAVVTQQLATVVTAGSPGVVRRTTTSIGGPAQVDANHSYSAYCQLTTSALVGVAAVYAGYDLPVSAGTSLP